MSGLRDNVHHFQLKCCERERRRWKRRSMIPLEGEGKSEGGSEGVIEGGR